MASPPAPRELDALATHTISRDGVMPGEIGAELAALGARWTVAGGELSLTLRGPMARTGAVAAFAGALADELDHHPKITIEYAGLTLAIHTHDAQGLTVLDLVFAARLEQWLRTNAW
jgi:4a-hydroxytetrahydrobiopterin dehydratase